MATYPQLDGVGIATPVNETQITQTDGSILRGQVLKSNTLFSIVIVHHLLSVDDVLTLQAFFTANRNTSITTQPFTDGESYAGKLLKEPEVEVVSSDWNKVTQSLLGQRV
jgi:hypothetical protein